MLELRGIDAFYGQSQILFDLSLSVAAGEVVTLLGRNGMGKTTTLRIVAGLLRPDAGSVHVFGVDALADPIAAKRMIAWVSDEPLIYDKLTPFEYLEFVADQRLGNLGLEKRYGSKNPFGFMELQDMQELSNFFERRVSAYQVSVSGEVSFDESF